MNLKIKAELTPSQRETVMALAAAAERNGATSMSVAREDVKRDAVLEIGFVHRGRRVERTMMFRNTDPHKRIDAALGRLSVTLQREMGEQWR